MEAPQIPVRTDRPSIIGIVPPCTSPAETEVHAAHSSTAAEMHWVAR